MSEIEDLLADASQAHIAELESQITKAREDYYNGTSTVSDELYDAWVDELADLKADSPAVTAIGAPVPKVSEWKKVAHTTPMGSLSKLNTMDEMTAWILKVSTGVEPLLLTEKLDGLSISVIYEKGAFSQAITRGDGETGEDISVNVVKMQGVPGRLKTRKTIKLRGEIVLTKTDHAKYFAEYSNPRNAASGISKRLDGQGCDHLTILFFQVADGVDFDSEGEQFEWLESQGLKVPNWYVTAMAPGVKTPQDLWVDYQQTIRAELDYEIDGLVCRLNNMANQLALGETNGRPHGAVAFKFAPMTRETVLRRIDWQVGGSGRITPVGVFDPVRLVGAEVTQASLYNMRYIQDLGLDVGATIMVVRANDVIPRVVSVIKPTPTVAFAPDTCPICYEALQMEGEYLVCPNITGCAAQNAGRIKRYTSALDIKEWGDVLIEKLVESGLVESPADLYGLTEEVLASIERMGERSAQAVLKTLWAKNPIPMHSLLGSLSIPGCGRSTIKMCVDAGYDSVDKLKAADVASLAKVEGLGPVKAATLHSWFREHGGLVDDLLAAGVKIQERVTGVLTGKQVCFTGSLSMPRGELVALVTGAGGEVKNSVTKKLSYLVMADPSSNSSKAKAARKNGTQCISEDDLLEMLA